MLMRPRKTRRHDTHILNIPEKANRILNIILVAMLLIVVRIWHLAVIQYEDKLEEAKKPRARVVVEPAKRATIRDRFNIPLAINKMRYQATVLYAQLLEIPSVAWETDAHGKRVKRFKRKEYISSLSKLLGTELGMDSDRIEDLIYSKAAFLYQVPFILKEDISEREYYRLKMLQKDWPGIQVRFAPKRYYPQGRLGADIIGYMGAINRQQYDAIIHEIKSLESYLHESETGEEIELPNGISNTAQARERLKELQERAYTINDFVGKSGIEGVFEEELRGFHGKTIYYADAQGNFLHELPGAREPLSGHRLLLTISSELQEYAEQLLIKNEQIREGRIDYQGEYGKHGIIKHPPWIKGGAIVAMDPQTGEVLALASHPRFDPNDFILSGIAEEKEEKRSHILQWFENEAFLAEVWDQKRPLTREIYDDSKKQICDQSRILNWDNYLNSILPEESPVKDALIKIGTVGNAVALQKDFNQLLELSGQTNPYLVLNRLYQDEEGHTLYQTVGSDGTIETNFRIYPKTVSDLKKRLSPFLEPVKHNYDKLLVIDLCRLIVSSEHFSEMLLQQVGSQTLASYKDASSSMVIATEAIKKKAKQLFHVQQFKQWRKENEKKFLKEKRKEEKLQKHYARPYLDYLDAQENMLFQEFWNKHYWDFVAFFIGGNHLPNEELMPYFEAIAALDIKKPIEELSPKVALEYVRTMRGFQELNRPLLGKYRHLRSKNGVQLERHLATAFYPVYGYGYGRSQAYRQASIQGSIFKLITAYTALKQEYLRGKVNQFNPLEIIDDVHRNGKNWFVGYRLDGSSIPQLYKGGRLPRSRIPNMGKVDLMKALEISSNPYFSLLASEVIQSPTDLADTAREFSYGSRTGIDLPAEIGGKVPDDLEENPTGLYSFAIGQHSLVVTPLQTAVMLSSIANGGKVLKPKLIRLTAGRERQSNKDFIIQKAHFGYQDSFAFAGIDFPLFTAVEGREQESLINRFGTEIKHEVFLPESIRLFLLRAMQRVTQRGHSEGTASLTRLYYKHPEVMQSHQELKEEIIGKTSTSQALENLNLDLSEGTLMCTHVWYGGVSFNKSSKGEQTFVFHDEFGQPELVVVVYLRFGSFGKEAAPLASQVVKKWREIKAKHDS